MTDLDHLLWFIAAAAIITTLLTVGTLAAAGLIPRRSQESAERRATPREE